MGRLIDADNLQFNGRNYNKSQMKAILDFIDAQPTAYDVDKVVAQLNDKFRVVRTDEDLEWNRAMDDAITIAKGGGVE